jgi:hypothetical protein
MRRFCLTLAFALCALPAFSQCPSSAFTTTTNLGLYLPKAGTQNWNLCLNPNFQAIDAAIGVLQAPFQGAWSSTTVYSKGQYVTYGGSTYISTINSNFNNTPSVGSSAWQFFFTPGSSSWGGITGLLSSQTDLQNALNLKAPLASPAFTGAPTAPTATPGTGGAQIASQAYADTSSAAAAAQVGAFASAQVPEWVLSKNCGGVFSNCTQVHGDGQYVTDATSTSTTTVTCPNSDCNFVAGDVGKTVWATNQGTGAGTGYLLYTNSICPITTITAVNSAQSITVGSACTASGTGNVVLYWGHKDGAALASLDAAVGCSTIRNASGSGLIFDDQPFLVTAPSSTLCNQQLTSSVGNLAPAFAGAGAGGSQTNIMLTPDFNFSGCKTPPSGAGGASGKICIGATARAISNLQVLGSGLISTQNSNCANGANDIILSASPVSGVLFGVDVGGVCPGESGMIGIELNSTDEVLSEGGVQEVGTIACHGYGTTQMVLLADDCSDTQVSGGTGLVLDHNALVTSFSSKPIDGLFVASGSTFNSNEDLINLTATIATGGAATFSKSKLANAVVIQSGATVSADNSNFGGIENSGTFFSGVNLKTSFVQSNVSTTQWAGQGVLFGSCRGTATSSATLGLYGLGQLSTPNCTSTTVNQGTPVQIVPNSGSVIGLYCKAGTGGVSPSSGVVTVLKNGAATTLTCTLGNGTSCVDNTHFDIPSVGDVYSIQFTTQASETLANVSCSVLAF